MTVSEWRARPSSTASRHRADRIQPLVNWVDECFPGVDTRRVEPWAGLRPMMPNMLTRVGAGKKPTFFTIPATGTWVGR